MTTSLRLVDGSSDPTGSSVNTPLVRGEHDQKYVVRNADRELTRLLEQRPDLRDQFEAMRDEFTKSVNDAGKQFRASGGRNYLNFAQNLARMRRDLSSSLRNLVQQNPAPGTTPTSPATPQPLPNGRLDVRG